MKKISLGIDGRVLFRDNIRGIGRYLKNIIQLAPKDFDVIVYGPKEYERFFNISVPTNVKIKTFDLKGYRIQSWEQIGLPFFMLYKRHDILFCPANSAPLIQLCKTITTLHDAHLWLSDDDYGILRWYYKYLLPMAFRHLNYVITISEFSKKELLSIFPFLENRIKVIYHGIEPVFKPEICFDPDLIPNGITIKKPYLFYIGGESPKKQPDFAIKLFLRVKKIWPNLSLLMLGISEEKRTLYSNKVKKDGIGSDIVVLPPISDELLAMLYSNAEVVLYPTLHEGFGFPVLEAMASKVPILASNVASIPEVSGGFAFLLPPTDIERWEETLRWIISHKNSMLLKTKLENGHKWASAFSWNRTCEQTFDLFRNVRGVK